MNRTESYKLNLNLSNFSQRDIQTPKPNLVINKIQSNNTLSAQNSNDNTGMMGRLSRLASPIPTSSPTPTNSFVHFLNKNPLTIETNLNQYDKYNDKSPIKSPLFNEMMVSPRYTNNEFKFNNINSILNRSKSPLKLNLIDATANENNLKHKSPMSTRTLNYSQIDESKINCTD